MASTEVRPELPKDVAKTYANLEERLLQRDQIGSSQVFYQLVKDGRSASEIIGEVVRIHAPYTNVPYHQIMQNGSVRFVNNDHCLLSNRVSMHLPSYLSPELSYLPLAQTLWYVPTALDPHNQVIGKALGHYLRSPLNPEDSLPPQIHWPDQEPEPLDCSFEEGMSQWLNLCQRSEVLPAYKLFLGLFEDVPNRNRLLAELGFAGLIDVQDRLLYTRSYTTGHKAMRARATIELGEMMGWDAGGHNALFAGVPDMATGPHWHTNYEMASILVQNAFEGHDHDLLETNTDDFNEMEIDEALEIFLKGEDTIWQAHITNLLKGGKSPSKILDVIQLAANEIMHRIVDTRGYGIPGHAHEYCNTLQWYWSKFDHPHKVKLLYVAASFVNQCGAHQSHSLGCNPKVIDVPAFARELSQKQLLSQINEALLGTDNILSVALTQAYLQSSYDRAPLVELLTYAGCRFGNDPHLQELGLCFTEDYLKTSLTSRRDFFLLASANHTTGYRRYGNPLEGFERFVEAMDISAN